MVWYGWLALAVILGGTGWLCAKLHDPKGGTVGCCGCGKGAGTGEWNYVKERRRQMAEEKREEKPCKCTKSVLTKLTKRI